MLRTMNAYCAGILYGLALSLPLLTLTFLITQGASL
jgi:hypothetical protein